MLLSYEAMDLDRYLERRGLSSVRYADDCNIYVGSEVAGKCVMRGISAFLEPASHVPRGWTVNERD